MVNLAQYSIEQILLDKAETQPELIDIRWQTRVTGVEARGDGVRLALSTPAGDYSLQADWVVAADGGRSFLRDALGLKLEGTSYEGRYVIVDILLDSAPRPSVSPTSIRPAIRARRSWCTSSRQRLAHRLPAARRRGPDEAIKPENVMPRVEACSR
jgi:3-(3-hydroxy-phenyl)propionate hydroxylase